MNIYTFHYKNTHGYDHWMLLPPLGYMSHVTFLKSENVKFWNTPVPRVSKETVELYFSVPEEIKNRMKNEGNGEPVEQNS